MNPSTTLILTHLPGVVDAFGKTGREARQAFQVDNIAAAPLGCELDPVDNTNSYLLPTIVDRGTTTTQVVIPLPRAYAVTLSPTAWAS